MDFLEWENFEAVTFVLGTSNWSRIDKYKGYSSKFFCFLVIGEVEKKQPKQC